MTDNKFKTGDAVYARIYPNVKLLVRLHIDAIYFCRVADTVGRSELVYFEKELLAEHDPARRW